MIPSYLEFLKPGNKLGHIAEVECERIVRGHEGREAGIRLHLGRIDARP